MYSLIKKNIRDTKLSKALRLLISNHNTKQISSSSNFTHKILLKTNFQNNLYDPRISVSQTVKFSTSSTSETSSETVNAETSIDEKEIGKFKQLANEWWTENGEFEALHRMNKLRVPLIRDAMSNYLETMSKSERELVNKKIQSENVTISALVEPLAGLNILDIGCGGGILSEALARLGANVTGVDACKENVITAQMRIQSEYERSKEHFAYCKRLRYIHCTVEDLAAVEENGGYFDGVVLSEVIEHVSNPKSFIENSSRLLKNHGYIFVTTINRTPQSYALAIVGAEYIMNIVPKGTHDWKKFLKPSEVKQFLAQNEISVKFEMGMAYNPITRIWSWCRDDTVSYAVYGQKQKTSI